jgi:hypothetical protein
MEIVIVNISNNSPFKLIRIGIISALTFMHVSACAAPEQKRITYVPKNQTTTENLSINLTEAGKLVLSDQKGVPLPSFPVEEIPVGKIQSLKTYNVFRFHHNPCVIYFCNGGCQRITVSDSACR